MTRLFDEMVTADVVVVGTGIAGLSTALSLGSRRVIVLSKAGIADGSTKYAQGGIAAAVADGDDPGDHAADTVAVGGGINDVHAVSVLTAEAPGRIRDLVERGVRFDCDAGGLPVLSREAGHRRRRVLHADGDATGSEISRALTSAAASSDGITVVDHAFAVDLAVGGGRVVGLTARAGDGARLLFAAPAVVLATGGIGRLYANTTNPEAVTGDGLAIAARAGVRLADLEFVQFHPTALASGRDPMSLLTEALRGDGAVLIDERGSRFMIGEHADAELAPRDVVARAIWKVLASGGRVFLDARDAVGAEFPERYPTVFGLCLDDGIDPRRRPMPAAPAAHYHMGGIATDLAGRTSLRGLWAVGEAARTGVHGANRLASNSLLEGAVFAGRAAADILSADLPPVGWTELRRAAADPGPVPQPQPDVVASLRDLMWDRVGLVRDRGGLVAALEEMDRLDAKLSGGIGEAHNMLTAARLVTVAALIRTESRGGHYRSDHPEPRGEWRRSIEFNR